MKSILAKLTKMSFNLALVLRVLQTSFAVVVMMLTAFGKSYPPSNINRQEHD